ncbi:MAG: aminoacyl-histidine dipeptidase [Prevotellaceae bacterium]|jgi:dipeptidase D|nr:aminoacyl-histidine dipeptidase [Prevotellaceae bacterium]
MDAINKLSPQSVFSYFTEVCAVPRPSKKEEKIIDYLMDFAHTHHLEAKKDDAGNVLIIKPATKGMERRKTVVLQSHLDMVGEKNSETQHDFETDPIIPYIEGGWVKAKDTTLGADCGIGIAAQLAVLTDDTLQHGCIECLFTVDEETGLTGAKALQTGFFDGKILLNLDSEDEGELFIGCAGGIDTTVLFTYDTEPVPSNYIAFKLSVSGLQGGHSGDDINKGRGNANKILNRFLWHGNVKYDLRISQFDGGNLRNAIAREAFAVVTVHKASKDALMSDFNNYVNIIKAEYKITEPHLQLNIKEVPIPTSVIDESTQYELLNSIYACPYGVLAMSFEVENLVETSTNLASVKFIKNNQILITTSQRSASDSAKHDAANTVRSVFQLTNASIEHGDGYPGWKPNKNSEILHITKTTYQKLFNVEPEVKAIHAGLECGLFLEKYPDLDMISFGPTIKGAHSPDERLEISTVQKFWDLLTEVLRNIPEEKK